MTSIHLYHHHPFLPSTHLVLKMTTGSKEVEIIGILGSSQGVVSVVSALLAGASGTMLTSVSEEALVRAGFVSYLFVISASLGTALNLGTAIICIVSEQQSKVAQAFSLLRESDSFDKNLEEWWRDFAVLRTRALWCFLYSVPLTYFTMACQCYIMNLNMIGVVGFSVFVFIGGSIFYSLLKMNELFRLKVLQLSRSSHSAPVYYSDSRRVIAAESATGLSSLSNERHSRLDSCVVADDADFGKALPRRRSTRKKNIAAAAADSPGV